MIYDVTIIISITFIVLLLGILYVRINRNKTIEQELKMSDEIAQNVALEVLKERVLEQINIYTREKFYDKGYSDREYRNELNKQLDFKASLDKCKTGSLGDKNNVKAHIYDFIYEIIPDNLINEPIAFEDVGKLSIQEKFEILLYIYKEKKEFGYNALRNMIREYDLDSIKNVIEDGRDSYIITPNEIENIFNEVYHEYKLTFRDKLQIITQRVYQEIKGLGVIDEVRDQNIDGVSGGVSGRNGVDVEEITVQDFIYQHKFNKMNYDSVWCMFDGKSIHLSFLSFGTEAELIRVCKLIYKHNRPGELSAKRGYVINDMADNSRVVVARPGFCESWVFFVRKFSKSINSLQDIYIEEKNSGSEVLIQLMTFLIWGQCVTTVTGAQGVGKTTVLKALIKEIDATLPLRVFETAFEVHGRDLYADRNIVSFREYGPITEQEGIVLGKKTNGSVYVLGEVASAEVVVNWIDMAQVAALFVLATHHAKTTHNLVESMKNALLKTGAFNDEKVAANEVISVLDFDIHLNKDTHGNRYIERITEVVPIDKIKYDRDFSELSEEEMRRKYYTESIKYFEGMTGRKEFKTVNILEYEDGAYRIKNMISAPLFKEMRSKMSPERQMKFNTFISEQWGVTM